MAGVFVPRMFGWPRPTAFRMVVGHAVDPVVDVQPQLGVDHGDHRPGEQQQGHHPAAPRGQPLEHERDQRADHQFHEDRDERVDDGEAERVMPRRVLEHDRVVVPGEAVQAGAVARHGHVRKAHHHRVDDREDGDGRHDDQGGSGEGPAQPGHPFTVDVRAANQGRGRLNVVRRCLRCVVIGHPLVPGRSSPRPGHVIFVARKAAQGQQALRRACWPWAPAARLQAAGRAGQGRVRGRLGGGHGRRR